MELGNFHIAVQPLPTNLSETFCERQHASKFVAVGMGWVEWVEQLPLKLQLKGSKSKQLFDAQESRLDTSKSDGISRHGE